MLPETTLLEISGIVKPDAYTMENFTLTKTTVVSFHAEVEHKEGRLLCYVIKWDPIRFDSLEDHLTWALDQEASFAEAPYGPFPSLTMRFVYVNKINFNLRLEPGEWGLIIIQTALDLGEMKYNVKVTSVRF